MVKINIYIKHEVYHLSTQLSDISIFTMLCNDQRYFNNFSIIPRRESLLKHRSELRGCHCSASQHPVALHFTQERPRFFLGHMTLCATVWPLASALRSLRFLAFLLCLQQGIKLLLQALCTCFSLFWIILEYSSYMLSFQGLWTLFQKKKKKPVLCSFTQFISQSPGKKHMAHSNL